LKEENVLIQQKIDGQLLKEMILTAATVLQNNKKAVDSLNVFPVPDGDTGTNMSLTMMSAVKEVKGIHSKSVAEVSDALARGALKGARGNSGVILSQLFRGFSRGLKGYMEADGYQLALALKEGVDTAYKAVMKPTEGTILTVARVSSEEALSQGKKGANAFTVIDTLVESAEKTLKRTPEMLPVLKQAGVVDAGGKGLFFIYKGFKMAMDGEEVPNIDLEENRIDEGDRDNVQKDFSTESIQFGYCTEFFIQNLYPAVTEREINKLREKLNRIGDSLIVVGDEDLVKVHVHTNVPGKALQFALRLGELSKIKIDNMREQHRHITEYESLEENTPSLPLKKYGLVSVAMGKGIAGIFKDLSVDQIIEGGQTMNPSIEDIYNAIEAVPSENVFVLPNNSNIILAAEQAKNLTKKNVAVIPSKSIPQGLAAVLAFNPDSSFEENMERMVNSIGTVKTGQVTYAVRASSFDGKDIQEGDIIGLYNGKILSVGKDIPQVSFNLLREIVDENDEIITVFYGEGINEQDVEDLSRRLQEAFPDCDIEFHNGGQPLYYYIFSVE